MEQMIQQYGMVRSPKALHKITTQYIQKFKKKAGLGYQILTACLCSTKYVTETLFEV